MFGFFDFLFESVPSNRTTYCAYVLLKSKDTNEAKGQIKGTYVQGFYQLAKEQGLRCQRIRETFKGVNARDHFQNAHPDLYKQLYRCNDEGNDVIKNAFELAIVPEMNEGDIFNIIREEYNYQNQEGLLPQAVFKVQMMKEWLGLLDQTYFAFEGLESGSGTNITLSNPDVRQKGKEKFLHSALQFLGFFSTIKTFFTCGIPFALLMAFSPMTPAVALASSIGALFLFKTLHLSDYFGFSDMAEVLWNDVRWLSSKHFINSKSPFSFTKAMRSACYLLAIVAFAAFCAQGAFIGVLSLVVPMIGLSMAAYAIAGLLAGLSFMGTCIGLTLPLRYMEGFGVRDNTISADLIKQSEVPDLKPTKLRPASTFEAPTKAQRKNVKLRACTDKLLELGQQLPYVSSHSSNQKRKTA